VILSVKVSLDDGQVRIGRCHLGEESRLGVGGLHRYDFIVDDDRPDGDAHPETVAVDQPQSNQPPCPHPPPPSELQWWFWEN